MTITLAKARRFAGLLLIAPLLLTSAGEAATVKIRVKASLANIRSGPAMVSAVIGQAPRGTVFESEAKEGEWFKVNLPPDKQGAVKAGYIHQSVVEIIEEPQKAAGQEEAAKKEAAKIEAIPAAKAEAKPRELPASLAGPKLKKFEICLLGGAGYTAVDIAKDIEIDEKYLRDWDQFHWALRAQIIYRITPSVGIGAEYGFSSLYYFYYAYPMSEYQTAYRENTITASNLSAVLDFRFGEYFTAQILPGLYLFEERTIFGFAGVIGGELPIGESLAIPIMIRFDLLPNGPSPVAFLSGLKIRI